MMFGRGYNGFSNSFGFGSRFMYGGWGMIMMAAFLLAVITVIYFAKRTGHRQSSYEAMDALKMRLAKGEISEEEFLKRKNILA
jgi:uncharacterized membrane protein